MGLRDLARALFASNAKTEAEWGMTYLSNAEVELMKARGATHNRDSWVRFAVSSLSEARACALDEEGRERLAKLEADPLIREWQTAPVTESRLEALQRAFEEEASQMRAAGYRLCEGCDEWFERSDPPGPPYCRSCRAGLAGARDLRRKLGM